MVLASLGPIEVNSNGSLTSLQPQTFDANTVTIASSFSVDLSDPGFPILALSVTKTISECLQQYCDNGNGCIGGGKFCSLNSLLADGNFSDAAEYCYTDICSGNGASSLNPDIAGVGVWRSLLPSNLIALTELE